MLRLLLCTGLSLIVAAPQLRAADGRPFALGEFLEQHCTACHGAPDEDPPASVSLSGLAARPQEGDTGPVWLRVLDALRFEVMPLIDEAQPFLDAMSPLTALGEHRGAAAPAETPLRFAFLYVPNGMTQAGYCQRVAAR